MISLLLALWAMAGGAAGAELRLAAPPALAETGLPRHLAPRFALKHGVRAEILPVPIAEMPELAGAGGADAFLVPAGEEAPLLDVGLISAGPMFADGAGRVWLLLRRPGDDRGAELAAGFADWLRGEPGRRALDGFHGPGGERFTAEVPAAAARSRLPLSEGDPELGRQLVERHCQRCHVVSPDRPFAGIGSTPSLMALRALPDWEEKFTSFWTVPPHAAVIRVPELTGGFDVANPPHVRPVELTLEEVEAILAHVERIEPADLGAPLEIRE